MEIAQIIGISTLASLLLQRLIDAIGALLKKGKTEGHKEAQLESIKSTIEEIKRDNIERKTAILADLQKVDTRFSEQVSEVHRHISDVDKEMRVINLEMKKVSDLAQNIDGQLKGITLAIEMLRENKRG